MDETIQKEFETQWKRFLDKLKGRLLEESQRINLAYPMAKLILNETALCWENEYDICGRWLKEYAQKEPEKAKLIITVLTKDICFTEPEEIGSDSNTNLINIAIPAAGAAAGFGVSSLLHVGTAAKTLSTVIPAAVLYPIARTVSEGCEADHKDSQIDAYMLQLEKYENDVVRILTGSYTFR